MKGIYCTLNISHYSLLAYVVSEKSDVMLVFASLWVRCYFLLTSFKYYTPLFEEYSWFHLACLLSFLLFFKQQAEFVFCEWLTEKIVKFLYWILESTENAQLWIQEERCSINTNIWNGFVNIFVLIVIYLICKWRLWKIKSCF